MDVVSPAVRSRMMAGIRGWDTRPEVQLRKILHAQGFRFSLHRRDLPGKPDIVLPKYKAVIFVHGCFWHRHRCSAFKWPSSNKAFWRKKLNANVLRDQQAVQNLLSIEWRVAIVWECAIPMVGNSTSLAVIRRLDRWIRAKSLFLEIGAL